MVSLVEVIAQFVPLTLIFLALLTSYVYRVLCRNLMMKSLHLSSVAKFNSEIKPVRYIWIYFSNSILIIGSLGLLIPWARVRAYSYLVNCTSISLTDEVQKIVDEWSSDKSSFGEEFAELEGIEATI